MERPGGIRIRSVAICDTRVSAYGVFNYSGDMCLMLGFGEQTSRGRLRNEFRPHGGVLSWRCALLVSSKIGPWDGALDYSERPVIRILEGIMRGIPQETKGARRLRRFRIFHPLSVCQCWLLAKKFNGERLGDKKRGKKETWSQLGRKRPRFAKRFAL